MDQERGAKLMLLALLLWGVALLIGLLAVVARRAH
jgi:hypothetical protein